MVLIRWCIYHNYCLLLFTRSLSIFGPSHFPAVMINRLRSFYCNWFWLRFWAIIFSCYDDQAPIWVWCIYHSYWLLLFSCSVLFQDLLVVVLPLLMWNTAILLSRYMLKMYSLLYIMILFSIFFTWQHLLWCCCSTNFRHDQQQ